MIEVLGVACRFPPAARTTQEYWAVLEAANAVAGPYPASRGGPAVETAAVRGSFLEGLELWDPMPYGMNDAEALRLDPQHRLVLDVVWDALRDANVCHDSLRNSRTGFFVSVGDSQQYSQLQLGADPSSFRDPYFALGNSASVIAGRLAFLLDCHGPALNVDTACSSALVATHLACRSLAEGECDLAVVTSASAVLHPRTYGAAFDTGMIARDGRCKTFQREADGFGLAEGAGAIVLRRCETSSSEKPPPRALIVGSAINQDGASGVLAAPSMDAQVGVIQAALAAARLGPDDVDFVEAHGSGTPLGDAIEMDALERVFASRTRERLPVGAAKSVIGHTLVVAGLAGLIKAVLELERRRLTPNARSGEENPVLRRLRHVKSAEAGSLPPVGTLNAGVSAFGWSGSNAHVILRSAGVPRSTERLPPTRQPRRFWPVPERLPLPGGHPEPPVAGRGPLHTYSLEWQPLQELPAPASLGPRLIVIGPEHLASLWAAVPGENRHQTMVLPREPLAQRQRLLDLVPDATGDGRACVLYLSATEPGQKDPTPAAAVMEFLETVRLLVHSSALQVVDLVVVGDFKGDRPADFTADAVIGTMHALEAELPRVRFASVVTDDEQTPGNVLDAARTALGLSGEAAATGRRLRVRRGTSSTRQAIKRAPSDESASRPRAVGSCVITGGTKGIGLALAQQLVADGVRRLALIGSSPLPPRHRWPDVLAGGAETAEVATLQAVLGMERAGADIMLICADLAEPTCMQDALEAVSQEFGSIDTLYHLAGRPPAGLLEGRVDGSAAQRVIDPKVQPLRAISKALDEQLVGRVVLFSSAVTVIPTLGTSDYAAANACLDAFAERPAVITISWGPWKHDAWGLFGGADALRDAQKYRDQAGIDLSAGLDALKELVTCGLAHALVLPESLEAITHRVRLLNEPVLPSFTAERRMRPALTASYRPPASEIQRLLAQQWEAALGISGIGVDDPFLELGGSSLVGVALVRQLERQFQRALPAGLLFEHFTVAALAQYLDTTADVTLSPLGGRR